MARIFYNQTKNETTFDYGTALGWAADGEIVSEYQKVTEFGGD